MMEVTSFYTAEELASLGLASYGREVRISRKTSLYAPERMHLGHHVRIDDYCLLSGGIAIGNHVHIASYCALFGAEGIVMEDYSGIASRVLIYTVTDDYVGEGLTNPTVDEAFRMLHRGPVRLRRHVIVGAGTVILPSVTLSEGSAVGAMSLVTCDCEAWTLYAGIPAKRIKARRRDVILDYQRRLEEEENAG